MGRNKRVVRSALALVAIASGLLAGLAAPAYACSLIPEYRVPLDLLADEAAFADHYRADWVNEGEPVPDVVGVYRYSIVESVDPVVLDGRQEISRGSVGVVTDYWGQPPAETGPAAYSQPVRWERIPDSGACEFLSYPANVDAGTSWYTVLTADGSELSTDDGAAPASALDAAFGPGTEVERDEATEQALLAEMQATHDDLVGEHQLGQVTRWLVIGSALVLVAGITATGLRSRQRRQASTCTGVPSGSSAGR